MKNTIYKIVYKSSYHGETYSDCCAIPISEPCLAADIMEIIEVEASSQNSESKFSDFDCHSLSRCFTDKEAAIEALRAMS